MGTGRDGDTVRETERRKTMIVAIDLTGDMISYSYHDGKEIVTEKLQNTIGFRMPELFQRDGALRALMKVTKDMIEYTLGNPVTEAVCAVPSYCSYSDKKQLRSAASECGLKLVRVIRGTLASALLLFQATKPDHNTNILCSVYSDYAGFMVYKTDGDKLQVLGSTPLRFDKEAGTKDPEGLKKRILSEMKALYGELSMTYGEKGEAIFVAFDENAEAERDVFRNALEECFGPRIVTYADDAAKGAYYLLMKQMSFRTDEIRECSLTDCSVESFSIVSGVNDDLKDVFARNQPLPLQKTVDLMASTDNVVCFYAGNFRNRKLDEVIGTCRIPTQYRGQMIHVKMILNEEGIVEYTVLDAKKQIIYPKAYLR